MNDSTLLSLIKILESIKQLAGDTENLPGEFIEDSIEKKVLTLMNQYIDKFVGKENQNKYKNTIKKSPAKCYKFLDELINAVKQAASERGIKK